MKSIRLLYLLLTTTVLLGCNLPLLAPSTQAPANLPGNGSQTNPPATAPSTALPPLPAFTSVPPTAPQITSASAAVNCRSGPGLAYGVVDVINVGQNALIQGRSADGTWWYVLDPNQTGVYCWVAASVVTAAGNLSGIGIIAAPPLPTAPAFAVTSVTVSASVSTPVYCHGPNAIEFSGSITTNGPGKVQFRLEIGGDKSNTTSAQTLNFKTAATKSMPDQGSYSADCGHYTVTLHVLSPNDISATKKFSVQP